MIAGLLHGLYCAVQMSILCWSFKLSLVQMAECNLGLTTVNRKLIYSASFFNVWAVVAEGGGRPVPVTLTKCDNFSCCPSYVLSACCCKTTTMILQLWPVRVDGIRTCRSSLLTLLPFLKRKVLLFTGQTWFVGVQDRQKSMDVSTLGSRIKI